MAVLAVSCALPFSAVAATVNFFDLTDTVTTSTSDTSVPPRITFACPAAEHCVATVLAPTGAQFANVPTTAFNIFEPGNPNYVSDQIHIVSLAAAFGFTVDFLSDNEVSLTPIDGVSIIETGLLQPAGTIEWRNSDQTLIATDTINFQSDTEVPEPGTGLLILIGAPLVGLAIRRRRAA